jgi:uncharacterized membrane protein
MPDTKIEPLRLDGEDAGGGAVWSRASLAAFASVAGLLVAVRLWRLTASCLWFDEIFSVHAARHDWAGMLRFVSADLIHPPLFYALLKIWMAIGGESLLWLRLFPALTAAACVVPFSLLCRELRLPPPQTILALLLMATSGYLIKYAQEVRMYGLLLFFTLASLWLFVRFFNRGAAPGKRLLLALTIVNLSLVYTHYYGWLLVFAECAFLLLCVRTALRRSFFISVASVALCFAPWVYLLARAAAAGGAGLQQNLGWMARPGAADVLQFVVLLNEPFYFRQSSAELLYARWSAPLGLLLFGLPVLLLLWRELRRGRAVEKRTDGSDSSTGADSEGSGARSLSGRACGLLWLFLFAILPAGLAFFLSLLLPQSIWGTRHLIIVAPAYFILAAVAIRRLRPVWLRTAVLVVFGCWLFVAGLVTLARRDAPYIWCAWEESVARLREDGRGMSVRPSRLYAFEDLVAYHLWFALDVAGEKDYEVAVVRNVPGVAEDPAYFLPRAFNRIAVADASGAFGEERFWAAFRANSFDESRPPLRLIRERGYHLEKVFERAAAGGGPRAFLVLATRAGPPK